MWCLIRSTSSLPSPVQLRFRPLEHSPDHRQREYRRQHLEACRRRWSQDANHPRNYRPDFSYSDRCKRKTGRPRTFDKMATKSVDASGWRYLTPRCASNYRLETVPAAGVGHALLYSSQEAREPRARWVNQNAACDPVRRHCRRHLDLGCDDPVTAACALYR